MIQNSKELRNNLLYKIKATGKKGLTIIGTISVIASFFFFLLPDLSSRLVAVYQSTIGLKASQYKTISELHAGANLSFFVDKLGVPALTQPWRGDETLQEDVFLNPFFIAETISNNGKVELYSVTVIDSNFKPKIVTPDGRKVTLGKTKFSEIFEGKVDKKNYLLGAHTFAYSEGEYLANPGLYQTVYFGMHELGMPTPDFSVMTHVEQWEITDDDLKNFRAGNTPNTYGETSPAGDDIISDPLLLGPDT